MSDTHSSTSSNMAEPNESHAPAAETHAAHDHHHLEHHIAMYWKVGGLLFAFTALTVGLSYVDFDSWGWLERVIGGHGNMKVGMVVAFFKVCLVAAIFMHLKEEKSTVWRILYPTFIFVAGLILLTLLAWADPIFGTGHWHH